MDVYADAFVQAYIDSAEAPPPDAAVAPADGSTASLGMQGGCSMELASRPRGTFIVFAMLLLGLKSTKRNKEPEYGDQQG